MKDLFLLFHGRFPSEKAASLFAAKSAEAFANEGFNVTLLVPRRFGRVKENPHTYYNVASNFKIVYLPVIDLFFIPFFKTLSFFISFFSFSLSSLIYLLTRASRKSLVYSNETLPLFLASFFFKNTFYEMHDFPESKSTLFNVFLIRMKFVLSHNQWKAKKLTELFKFPKEKILCEPNAVDLNEFNISLTQEEARKKLSLPLDKKIILYTGHLYSWKGVDVLAASAKGLPENYLVIFVGGTKVDIDEFKKKYGNEKNISIVGFVSHSSIPVWQCAADILVLPNTAKENISLYYTSPMKLFEYMASRRPIVASRIPSIIELIDDTCALLFKPDDPESLRRSLIRLCEDRVYAESLSHIAYERVKNYSWEKRAKRILKFIETLQ